MPDSKRNITINTLVILVLAILIAGCGGGGSPTAPSMTPGEPSPASAASAGNGNRITWGTWSISINTETLTAEVVPFRSADIHYNVLQMLEGWACPDCVSVESLHWSSKETLVAEIGIRHPYPFNRCDMTGFDVRGIAIFDGVDRYNGHYVRIPHDDEIMPIIASRTVLNPDGYTTHFNPLTAPLGNDLTDYKHGRLAPPLPQLPEPGNLHPFKEFSTLEEHRQFQPGYKITREYELSVRKQTFFTFAYSIDASWSIPLRWPVNCLNPISDFPISAASREAYQISMSIDENTLTQQDGYADVIFDVFDHQGYESISAITIEAPDLFYGVMNINPAAPVQIDDDRAQYRVTVNNTTGYAKTADGGSDLLIVVEDVDQSVVGEDVRAFNIFTLPVEDVARTWRPRGDWFINQPFPGMMPSGDNVDFTVVPEPPEPWAFNPGESMLIFTDDDNSMYIACSRNFDQAMAFAGYPGAPYSWLDPTRHLDAAATGTFGVTSDSDFPVSGEYLTRHCTHIHTGGGLYHTSWYTGTLGMPDPWLEIAGDVSGGYGNSPGDPVYSLYLYDPDTPYAIPEFQSVQRIADPYDDPDEVLRAWVPVKDALTGSVGAGGVSYSAFAALGIDDEPAGEANPLAVHLYAGENRPFGPTGNTREMDVFRINFANPQNIETIRIYGTTLLGGGSPWPATEEPRLVDIDVLPAATNNIYMGVGEYAQHNWIAVLYTFNTASWFIEIFDVHDDEIEPTAWQTEKYVIGPYTGHAYAMDVDTDEFEIYVMQDDPLGPSIYKMSCFEYY